VITIGEYTKLFVTITIGLGLICEMPILVFFLALMRMMTARWMSRNLRYSLLVIFVAAAIITTHHRYPWNNVSFRRSDDRTLRHQYRSGLAS